jgi:hypothetical protein
MKDTVWKSDSKSTRCLSQNSAILTNVPEHIIPGHLAITRLRKLTL